MPSQSKNRTPACPICGKPVVAATRPFCSSRCRDVDLANWFGEDYRIPSAEPADEADDIAIPGGGDDNVGRDEGTKDG